MDLIFPIRGKKKSIKCVMDLPHFGETELIGDRILMIVKGPSHLGVNFRLAMDHLRSLASSQTLSPLVKGVNPWLLCEDIT